MSPRKDSFYLFLLAALALAGIVALLGLGRPVPSDLWTLGALVIGGYVGLARQDSGAPASTQNVTLPNAVAPQINGTTTTAAAASAAVEGLAQDVPA